jgi:hypothetical protein
MNENQNVQKNGKTFFLYLFFYALLAVMLMAGISLIKQNRVDLSFEVVVLLTVFFINFIKLYGTRKKKIKGMTVFIGIKHDIKQEHGQLDPTEDLKNNDWLYQYKKYSWIALNMFIPFIFSYFFMIIIFPVYIPLGILSACLSLIFLGVF